MKKFVVYLAKALAGKPDEVATVEKTDENGCLTLELSVADTDLNQIIGKQGRTIKAMRTLLAAAAAKKGQRFSLKVSAERQS